MLGLIFRKYIASAFQEHRLRLEKEPYADPEDLDAYRAQNTFWVPRKAPFAHLKAHARKPTIGQLVDDAMAASERDTFSLKGVLPKAYARPALDTHRLGQLIGFISNIRVGDAQARAKDALGRMYEHFRKQFASKEGKKGGTCATPRWVVKLLVAMHEPFEDRVYHPCCGSSAMLVQPVAFRKALATGNGHKTSATSRISIYGQELNHTPWRCANLNLAIRGNDAQMAHGDTFHNHRFPDLKADSILANPPFNVADWGGERLREATPWKRAWEMRASPRRDRRGRVLFIDAHTMGRMVDRSHRELPDEDIRKIANTYHAWRVNWEAEGKDLRQRHLKDSAEEATVWIGGLDRRHRSRGILTCYNFSAMPFTPSGKKRGEEALLGWIVSDCGLNDAIESGLVKTPRVVVRDDAVPDAKTYKCRLYHIYNDPEVKDDLNRRANPEEPLPDLVLNAYYLLGYDWREAWKAWREAGLPTPPVMITVCNRTETAARIKHAFDSRRIHIDELCDPERILHIDSQVLAEAEAQHERAGRPQTRVENTDEEEEGDDSPPPTMAGSEDFPE